MTTPPGTRPKHFREGHSPQSRTIALSTSLHYSENCSNNNVSSAEYCLPASLHFAESDAIGGVVSARSVHKVGYGHKAQTKTSIC